MKTASLWAFIASVILVVRVVFSTIISLQLPLMFQNLRAILGAVFGGGIAILCYLALAVFFWKHYQKEKQEEENNN